MKNKILVFVICVVFIPLVLLACIEGNSTSADDSIKTLEGYRSSINYSCKEDQDCMIKDVGNCCGHYPACVNIDARSNRDLVDRLCQKSSMGGICGFPSIESCECVNDRCQGVMN